MTRVPYPEAARTLLHDTVLDAVDDLVRDRGWSATTMAHVATAAGVSRQTLYNEFGGRGPLVETYVAREIAVIIERVATSVRVHADDAHAALRAAFTLFLQLASDEPVIRILADDSDSGELYRLVTTLGRQLAGDTIAELVPQVWPQVGADDARLLADSLVRLAISHALVPADDPARVADDVGRMFARFVDELLEAQPGGDA